MEKEVKKPVMLSNEFSLDFLYTKSNRAHVHHQAAVG